MIRADLIYQRLFEKEMTFSALAKWMGYPSSKMHYKLNDLSGKRLSLLDAEKIMLCLDLPASVFINNDHIKRSVIAEAVRRAGFTFEWTADKRPSYYQRKKEKEKQDAYARKNEEG